MVQDTFTIDDVELGAGRSHAKKVLSHYGVDDQLLQEVVSLYTAATRSGMRAPHALEVATGISASTATPARVDDTSLDGLLARATDKHEPTENLIAGVYEALRSREQAPPRTLIAGRVYQRKKTPETDVLLIGVDQQKAVVDDQLRRLFFYNPLTGTNIENNNRSPGILFYGPPGTGKTSICKYAIAEAKRLSKLTALPFNYETIQSRDHSKWVGESAKAVHNKFLRAADPSGVGIVIIDDIDMVIPSRDQRDDSAGGLHMTNQLMQELDGVDARAYHNNLLLATTNKPENVDHALIKRRIPITLEVPKYQHLDEHKAFMSAYMPWASQEAQEATARYTLEENLAASQMSDVVKHLNRYRSGPISLDVLALPLEERISTRKKQLRDLTTQEVHEALRNYDCCS